MKLLNLSTINSNSKLLFEKVKPVILDQILKVMFNEKK